MAKALIITEKPSVAREFARVLGVSGRGDGYIENNEYVITWCVGHLVEMLYPEVYDEKYKRWRLEDLPFLPKDYKYDVIENVRKQYNIVHEMLFREDIDKVYWAGDSGKEGQTIEENIRSFGGVRPGMEELRVWIDSQTEEEILRGIREARPMSDYANLGKSGVMRAIEDYAMGINFSRVMSVKYGRLLNDTAGTENYTAIAVGRVMTCVLGMVVIREREIRNFVETPFYRLVGSFTEGSIEGEWKAVEGSAYFESPLLYKENGFKARESAEKLLSDLSGKEAVVKDLDKSLSKKKAPLLFNLAELQAECSKRFKISPDETLQAAQDLYEMKLTTYPRTDARVLSSAVAKVITKNLNGIKAYEPTKAFTDRILKEGMYRGLANSPYTDDSKVTDHYAIIPTGQTEAVKNLNDIQRKVFDLIVRRFLSIFYPPAVYNSVKLTIAVKYENAPSGEERFFAGAKVLKEPGYLEIAGRKTAEENTEGSANSGEGEEGEGENESNSRALLRIAESLKQGDVIPIKELMIKEGKTSPPKRYTSGSMVLAMENAGQLIEDEELRAQIKGSGIGTSATRAEIIKKLIRIGYLNLNKKSQILTPENLGEMVFEVVSMTVPQLLNPKMTASWEKGLDGITNGTVDVNDYRAKLEDFIRKETVSMIDQNIMAELVERVRLFAGKNAKGIGAKRKLGLACPICGGEVETTPFGYGCSNYKKDGTGCKFSIGTIAGKDLSEEHIRELLTEGKTSAIKGFVSKTKKKFDACLKLEKNEEGRTSLVFDFNSIPAEVIEDVKCPDCGGAMEVKPFGFGCANYKQDDPESCRFLIGTIAGKSLSVANVKELLTEGKTSTIRGFTSKTKKKFDACLKLEKNEEGKTSVVFDFEDVQPNVLEGVVCPDCGGGIEVKSFGYGCTNYKQDDPSSCKFLIGSIAGKSLSVANVKELLTEGQTSTIRGFTSKNKKKFDACLKLEKNEEGKTTVTFDFENVESKKIKDAKCPLCGGEIAVTPLGYGCDNFNREDENSCRFFIGKIAGVKLKEATVRELLVTGKTEVITGFKSKSGKKFDAALKLSEGRVEFDFPERPKPEETGLVCPKCGGKILKSQWAYECECGFRLQRTVAQVELPVEMIAELLANGRTKNRVTGFVSKAGNTFDTVLKLDEDGIKFDFEAEPEDAGENAGNNAAKGEDPMPWLDGHNAELEATTAEEATEQNDSEEVPDELPWSN